MQAGSPTALLIMITLTVSHRAPPPRWRRSVGRDESNHYEANHFVDESEARVAKIQLYSTMWNNI